MFTVCATCFNINELLVLSTEYIDVFYTFLRTEVDTGFLGPEAYAIFGALFKKNNTKLQIQN